MIVMNFSALSVIIAKAFSIFSVKFSLALTCSDHQAVTFGFGRSHYIKLLLYFPTTKQGKEND